MTRFSTFAARLDNRRALRIVCAAFAAVLLYFAFVPIYHSRPGHSMKDYELWHQTGTLVLQGHEVYPDRSRKFDFMYPPPCALFLAPLSLLGQTGLIVVLVLFNATAWIASVLLSLQLATGERKRPRTLLVLLPNLIVLLYVWGNFLIGQPSLFLLALMLGAFALLRRNNQLAAGGLIAIAAAIKAFPFIAIVYLLYRRYWIAAVSLVIATAFLLIALPAVFRGYSLAKQDLQRWSEGMLFKYDEAGVAQRQGRSNSWKNQSVFGLANRMLRHLDYDDRYAPHTPVFANVADLPFATVNKIIGAFALLLGLAYIAVMPAASGRTPDTDAIEFALLLLMILMLTPLSFGYLYAWLLYPFTVVLQRLLVCERTQLIGWALAAVALLALTIPLPRAAQTYGNTFFATLLLFIGLALELWRLKRETSRVPA